MKKTISLLLVLTFLTILSARAQQDSLLVLMTQELKREQSGFSKTDHPPYFISYRINDIQSTFLGASYGSLIHARSGHERMLTITLRIGDYQMDNTHPQNERNWDNLGQGRNNSYLPVDDSPKAIPYFLWIATQSEYRQALEDLKSVKNASTKSKYKGADLSKDTPQQYFEEPPPKLVFDQKEWEEKLRKYSQPFKENSDIVDGDVSLDIINERKYFVSTEGASIVENLRYVYLHINGSIRASDGDRVPLHRSYFAFNLNDLPNDGVVLGEVNQLIKKLVELQHAPLADPYTGPAILDAQAAGVFFHEIFGHRIEGHRLRNETDGQTFKEKINQPVLTKTLNVVFDPTRTRFNDKFLNGHYKFDDEGVKAQKVLVVEKGILKTFLMSRTPLEGLATSNGHGRASAGMDAVSRQSNLLVESSKPVSTQDLRKMLIQEAKKQGKPYGYFFKDVVGGFTNTDRYNPNAFNIFPTEVYRIYTDGRPDELVRGVDLIGTPLAMFAEIQAAGDKADVFTGFCGAESGNVPVSAISPSLFVRRIETQKKPQTEVEPMLLKSPVLQDENSK